MNLILWVDLGLPEQLLPITRPGTRVGTNCTRRAVSHWESAQNVSMRKLSSAGA
jgi:hypothetical protein